MNEQQLKELFYNEVFQEVEPVEHNRTTGYKIGFTDTVVIIRSGRKDLIDSGFSQSNVSSCIAGRIKQHRGYQWIQTFNKDVIDSLLNTRILGDERSIELYEGIV